MLVPLHWGTIYLGEGPPEKLVERFQSAALAHGIKEQDVWRLRIGETRALPMPLARRAGSLIDAGDATTVAGR